MIVMVVGLAFEARFAARAGMHVVCGGDGGTLGTSLNHAVMKGCSGFISFGVAGGLSPELRPGSCVVASAILSGAAQYMTDAIWSRTLLRLIPDAVYGAIVGVSSSVAQADAKRALHRDTGALAVDMESHIVASVASAHRLPMIAIRVVTDPAERALPEVALAAVRPNGTINIAAVICALLKRPHELPALVRTAIDLNAARATLRRGVQVLGSVPVWPREGEVAGKIGVPDLRVLSSFVEPQETVRC
jgi:adenosylhomocysteine nucleosidase